jgi:hypothetical protein
MKRVLIGVLAVIVVAAAGVYTFRGPLKQVAIDRMTAHMFISRDTDGYDPGILVGQAFPTIRARFDDRELIGLGPFMGKRGMVVYVNRSVDW